MLDYLRHYSRIIIVLMLFSMAAYAAGRLYFQLTAGFTEQNITADLTQEPDHALHPLKADELASLKKILDQPYRYLGKGCQSYVFASQDKLYVIKFLKYQRYRPQWYLETFAFIPQVERLREKKALAKRAKLDQLLNSWKIAYQYLQPETGIVYLHLNQTNELKAPLTIINKLGITHQINPDNVVFLVQKRADMLCKRITALMDKGDVAGAKQLLLNLLAMLQSENQRGLADQDHALMQNTGVSGDMPVHVDVGQFVAEDRYKDPAVYKEEIFSKTYKFRIWLSKRYPELENFLSAELLKLIGPEMDTMKPRLKTVDEGA